MFLVFPPSLCLMLSIHFFCPLTCAFRLNRSWQIEDFRFPTGNRPSLETSLRTCQTKPRCLHVERPSRTQAKRRNRNKHTMVKPLTVWTAKKCLARRTAWKYTCDVRTPDGALLRATFAGKHSATPLAWNSTRKFTRTRERSNANSVISHSNDPPRCLRTCLSIRIQDLSLVTTAARDFIKNRTWRSTPIFTRARSLTSVCSVGSRLASRPTSSHTAENILVSNRFHVTSVIEHSIEKLISGAMHTRMKWNSCRLKIHKAKGTFSVLINCEYSS